MDRREFLKSGAATIAALVLPKSKPVDTSELEKDLALWQEQAEFWQDETEWWREYAFRYAETINSICEALGISLDTPDLEVVEEVRRACDNLEWHRKLFREVVYPVCWTIRDAGYSPASNRWTDAHGSLLDLISDKAQFEEDVAYWKRRAEEFEEFFDFANYWLDRAVDRHSDICEAIDLPGSATKEDVLRKIDLLKTIRAHQGSLIHKLDGDVYDLKVENLRLRQKVNGLICCFVPWPFEEQYYLESDSVDADGNWHPVFAQVEEEPISQEEYYMDSVVIFDKPVGGDVIAEFDLGQPV